MIEHGAKQKSSIDLSCCTMLFSFEENIGMISTSTTHEWPDGLAYMAVQNLMARFSPTNTMKKVEMRQRLYQVRTKK
jgi:hypothetical protein